MNELLDNNNLLPEDADDFDYNSDILYDMIEFNGDEDRENRKRRHVRKQRGILVLPHLPQRNFWGNFQLEARGDFPRPGDAYGREGPLQDLNVHEMDTLSSMMNAARRIRAFRRCGRISKYFLWYTAWLVICIYLMLILLWYKSKYPCNVSDD